MCKISVCQRQGEEGRRQEGVAAKIHGHNPTLPILHEVDNLQVGYAEEQAEIGDLAGEVNTPRPPRLGQDLYQELSSGKQPRDERDKTRQKEITHPVYMTL